MIPCGHCNAFGFVNLHQIPEMEMPTSGEDWHDNVLKWIAEHDGHDVSVCTCCGNGESWHSDCPGYHDDFADRIDCL